MAYPFRVWVSSSMPVGSRCCHCRGSTRLVRYSSRRTPWDQLPTTGIQVVMVYLPEGRRQIFEGEDFYFYDPVADEYGAASNTTKAALQLLRPNAIILRGSWAELALFRLADRFAMESLENDSDGDGEL